MDLTLLAGPVIGAVIGYCTNYIAVRMLFRPLRPVKIGGFTLPFTPGIIPRGQARLSKAVGQAVGLNLLNEEAFSATLLSDETKEYLTGRVRRLAEEEKTDGRTIKELLLNVVDSESYEENLDQFQRHVTAHVFAQIKEMDVGGIVADEAMKAAKEKLTGGFLAMMMTDELLGSFREPLRDGINSYIDSNGEALLGPRIQAECRELLETPVGELAEKVEESNIALEQIVWRVYENIVGSHLASVLSHINLSGMIEDRIAAMDVMEVEELVLSVMKKELNAVVNLGALIGLILGLVNILVR